MELEIFNRLRNSYVRLAARKFCRRAFPIHGSMPYISFTFDDFPRSALRGGGSILQTHGLRGTYYASFGLMGKEAPTGSMFVREDLELLLDQGHELGCHTFRHSDSTLTPTDVFVASVKENTCALKKFSPSLTFRTLSYPLSQPRAGTKRRLEASFSCCRGGGQIFNEGVADANCLSGYFLEQSRDRPDEIMEMIDRNRRARGWLIFATHDISENPTQWGCTPKLFDDVVRYAVASGARICSVVEACEELGKAQSPTSDPQKAR